MAEKTKKSERAHIHITGMTCTTCAATIEAAATSEYKGKKYYFCSPGCKKAFDQDPEKYLVEEKK